MKMMRDVIIQSAEVKRLAGMTSRAHDARNTLQLSLWAGLLLTMAATQIGCTRAASQQAAPALELRSSSFAGDENG
jgi:hypothetical protein